MLFVTGFFALILAACVSIGDLPNTGNEQTPAATTTAPAMTATAPAATSTASVATPAAPTTANPLAHTEWWLESLGPAGSEQPAGAGRTVTLNFEAETQVSGSAGCNSYGGQYQIQDGKITFGQIVHTMMACADTQVMQQEQEYLQALQTTSEYTLSGGQLTITYDSGKGQLNFVPASTASAAAAPTTAAPVAASTQPAPASPTVEGSEAPAAPAQSGQGELPYVDSRSSPTALLRSYFNAIDRQEYARAYSYWRDPASAVGPFDAFMKGYENTASVEVTFGQISGDAGAGQLYYSVPVLLQAHTRDGKNQTYAACYVLHLSQPAIQDSPPFVPLSIEKGAAKILSDAVQAQSALATICTDLGLPTGGPYSPPATDPTDVSADNYVDDRSGPVEVLRSLVNAINRHEYLRAYSYWENAGDATAQVGPYSQFKQGYADTASVQLMTGAVSGDAGAGQRYYAVPVVLIARTTAGETQTFAGCYRLHLASPQIQAEPPFRPLAIMSATVSQAANNADTAALLNQSCAP